MAKAVMMLFAAMLALVAFTENSSAQEQSYSDQVIFGIRVQAGARYDDVRMCVASPPGAKGGMALEISFFTEIGVTEQISVLVNVPLMRPILFAAAFKMLQFEPEVALLFRQPQEGDVDIVVGPSLGITLHYGPDYKSGPSGEERGPSFWALGPRIGGYFGLDFKRPDKTFNFQLGVSPYVTPLFSVDDPDNHRGLVAGGTLDGSFRFAK